VPRDRVAPSGYIKVALDDSLIGDMTRARLKPMDVWSAVLRTISTNPESLKQAELAKDALDEFLLIEPTNASVERDANIVRLVKEACNNRTEADLLDSRVPCTA